MNLPAPQPQLHASVGDMERMARAIAASGLFGVQRPEQALALMLIAQAEGLPPAIAARDYHVIGTRPALKADAMLARFQAAGGRVRWEHLDESRAVGVLSHPAGGEVRIEWTIEMARSAGLTKNPTWQKFPRAMLRARVVSEGIRTVFPGVVVGAYTPEEIQDMEASEVTATVEREALPDYAAINRAYVAETIAEAATVCTLDDLKAWWSDVQAAMRGVSLSADQIAEITAAKNRRKAELVAPQAVAQPEFIDAAWSEPTTGKAASPITDGQRKAIQAHFCEFSREERLERIGATIGREISSVNDMTKDEASGLIDRLSIVGGA